jgi:hypothetical protein
LHGVSAGVPFVFTGFDWKYAATKLNLVTCFQIVTNQTQAPATANCGRARLDFKTLMLHRHRTCLPASANSNADAVSASFKW